MSFIVYVAFDAQLYEERVHAVIEIGSELIMHFTSVLLSQYLLLNYTDEARSAIELFTFILFGLLFALNIGFAIKTGVQSFRDKRRLKAIRKQNEIDYKNRQDKKHLKK